MSIDNAPRDSTCDLFYFAYHFLINPADRRRRGGPVGANTGREGRAHGHKTGRGPFSWALQLDPCMRESGRSTSHQRHVWNLFQRIREVFTAAYGTPLRLFNKTPPKRPPAPGNLLATTFGKIQLQSVAPFHLGKGRSPAKGTVYRLWIGSLLPPRDRFTDRANS